MVPLSCERCHESLCLLHLCSPPWSLARRLPPPHRRIRVKKNLYSDNVSGAAPEILRAIVESNADDSVPYGGDQYTQRLERRMAELFETEVAVYPVGTGTVANGLCAAIVCAPYGAIYCAELSHLQA